MLLSIGVSCVLLAAAIGTQAAPVPHSARKVVLDKRDTGYVYKTIEAPVPSPGPGQLLIRIHAIALNRDDLEPLSSPNPPAGLVPGIDGAGEVVAVGPGTNQFKVGSRVSTVYFPNWNDGPPT